MPISVPKRACTRCNGHGCQHGLLVMCRTSEHTASSAACAGCEGARGLVSAADCAMSESPGHASGAMLSSLHGLVPDRLHAHAFTGLPHLPLLASPLSACESHRSLPCFAAASGAVLCPRGPLLASAHTCRLVLHNARHTRSSCTPLHGTVGTSATQAACSAGWPVMCKRPWRAFMAAAEGHWPGLHPLV